MTMESGANSLVGVDVGGSGVKAALVDLDSGQATGRIRVETPQPATPDAIAHACRRSGVASFPARATIGCTMPAVVMNGVVRTATNIDKSWIGAARRRRVQRARPTGRASC